MNEELQAQALAAWLDACGSGAYIPAPPILDADVVEAIYALHPEFARPPRFSMDELLGELTRGPLAAKAQPPSLPEVEVSVLAVEPANKAPAITSKAPEAARRHRADASPATSSNRAASRQAPRSNERAWTRWMTGGAAGFTAAAAAWLLVISGDSVRESAHDAPAAVSVAPVAPRAADDAAAEGAAPAGTGLAEVAAAPTSKAVVAEALPLPAAAAVATGAPPAELAAEADGVAALDLAQAAPPPPAAPAQGLQADAPTATVAVDMLAAPQRAPRDEALGAPAAPMPMNAGAGNTAVIAESEAKSLKDAPSARRIEEAAKSEMQADDAEGASSGESAGPTYTDWRAGLSSDQRVRMESALSSAEAQARRGDPGGAARSLQPFIVQPARAGLNVAARAAELALQANDPRLASSLCERALKLGGAGTQERSRVDALLTKARQQSATLQLPR